MTAEGTQAAGQILLTTEDGIATITLNRPEAMNALSDAMVVELGGVLDDIERDAAIRVVILTGSGRAFCSGFDIAGARSNYDASSHWDEVNRWPEQLLRLHWLRQPTIAAVNGYALAAGNVLALSCDVVIAGRSARFGEPEIRHVGSSPFTFLPFMMPLKAATWLYLSGEVIDARTAERFGLVNRVVDDDLLPSAALEAARTLARVPPFAAQHQKRSINQTLDKMGYRSAFEHHLALRAWSGAVRDVPERLAFDQVRAERGLRGFLDARDGPFAGRELYANND